MPLEDLAADQVFRFVEVAWSESDTAITFRPSVAVGTALQLPDLAERVCHDRPLESRIQPVPCSLKAVLQRTFQTGRGIAARNTKRHYKV